MSCSSFSETQNYLLPEIHEMLSCNSKDDKNFVLFIITSVNESPEELSFIEASQELNLSGKPPPKIQ